MRPIKIRRCSPRAAAPGVPESGRRCAARSGHQGSHARRPTASQRTTPGRLRTAACRPSKCGDAGRESTPTTVAGRAGQRVLRIPEFQVPTHASRAPPIPHERGKMTPGCLGILESGNLKICRVARPGQAQSGRRTARIDPKRNLGRCCLMRDSFNEGRGESFKVVVMPGREVVHERENFFLSTQEDEATSQPLWVRPERFDSLLQHGEQGGVRGNASRKR